MSSPISRRGLLTAPLALAGCAAASPYFGRTTPPRSQQLIHSNGGEPGTLDPAQSHSTESDNVISALLDWLTALDPMTFEPAAALATHYEVDSRGTQYTFFLRGHPKPRGIRLPNRNSLPVEISRGRAAPPDRIPALWSDGTPVTAHDFAYSWRRLVDPATASPMASYLAPIRTTDARNPNALAVRAAGDFAFQFELVTPTHSFIKLLWNSFLAALPRGSIEAARRRGNPSSWLVGALSRKKDFGTASALRTLWLVLNITTPPLHRPAVRYALNLATDKKAITRFLGVGQKPANGIVPPMDNYPSLTTLPVLMNGRQLDVLAFDPPAARELLRAEGMAELTLSMTFPTLPNIKEVAAILQQQWREHLGVRVNLTAQGSAEWLQHLIEKRYRHITQNMWTARCADPTDYLELVVPPGHFTTWIDATFDRDFVEANAMLDPVERLKALAACEKQLMKAMPVIPIYHDVWTYLEAPYLRGLAPNPFAAPQFKYAWIDTNWRPS